MTSRREIDQAMRDAIAAGKLSSDATFKANVRLTVEGLGLAQDVKGQIALKWAAPSAPKAILTEAIPAVAAARAACRSP